MNRDGIAALFERADDALTELLSTVDRMSDQAANNQMTMSDLMDERDELREVLSEILSFEPDMTFNVGMAHTLKEHRSKVVNRAWDKCGK